MAHVQKLTAGAMGGLENHCTRKSDKHKNTLIDPKKTPLNYALDNNEKPLEYFKHRIGEVRINQRRDDIKVAASWVITQPRGIQSDESRQFFETAHNFLVQKYGEKNVVWSRVHMDESTPHLHFCFIPVTPDKKHNGEEKLCAKDVLNRGELQKFHGELSTEMKRVFGRDVGIETGNTEKNLELSTLKASTEYEKKANELHTITEKLDTAISRQRKFVDGRNLAKKMLTEQKEGLIGNSVKIDKNLLKKGIDYIWHSGGKDEKISALEDEVLSLKRSLQETKGNTQKAEIERNYAVKNRAEIQRELYTAKDENKKLQKIIEGVKKYDPQILEKAAQYETEKKRGRGFGR